jgi:hypothetical protein
VIEQSAEIQNGRKSTAARPVWTGPMKLLQPIACAVCGILLLADHAPQPTIHAAAPQSASGQVDGRANRGQKKDDNEEWTDVQQWMQQNCINQWTFYDQKLADHPVAQQRARKMMIEQYQRITGTKDPQMRDALISEARLHDNIFGVLLGFRRQQINRFATERRIEGYADELADVEIAIRRARINEINAEINELQSKRREYVASVLKREMNQAALPAGQLNATGYNARVLEEPTNPPAKKPGSTTQPADH